MKLFEVHVEEDKCIGAGQCVLRAPMVFDQREDGIVILLDATPAAQAHQAARKAADACPSQVTTIDEREM